MNSKKTKVRVECYQPELDRHQRESTEKVTVRVEGLDEDLEVQLSEIGYKNYIEAELLHYELGVALVVLPGGTQHRVPRERLIGGTC